MYLQQQTIIKAAELYLERALIEECGLQAQVAAVQDGHGIMLCPNGEETSAYPEVHSISTCGDDCLQHLNVY